MGEAMGSGRIGFPGEYDDEHHPFGSVTPPIIQSSNFVFDSYEALAACYGGTSDAPMYSRTDNPTVRMLERKLAILEGGDDALAVGSGMAAIASSILAFTKTGGRIVAIRHSYYDASRLFQVMMQRFGVDTVFVDPFDQAALEIALDGASVFYLESPSSFTFETYDIPALAAQARAAGAITIFDNSFASPLRQNPLAHGIDIVIHSMSKYLCGHSDVVAGCIVSRQALIEQIRQTVSPFVGAKLSALEAWLVMRGLRTLGPRLEAHERAAEALCDMLLDHPAVTDVRRPGVSAPLPPEMSGAGGLLTIDVADDVDVVAFSNALRVFRLGVSWGGFESLALPAKVTARDSDAALADRRLSLSHRSIRLFAGLEGSEMQIRDLKRALLAGMAGP